MLERFITLSNGLSFYVRNEYEKSRLEMTDSVELVQQIEKLYAHQCDAELESVGVKVGENGNSNGHINLCQCQVCK